MSHGLQKNMRALHSLGMSLYESYMFSLTRIGNLTKT